MSIFCTEVPSSSQQITENNGVVEHKTTYCVRKSFKDIFGVYLLESLSFEGDYDMPVVGNFDDLSCIDYLALYSDLKDYNKTENTCICFYQYDHVFDGVHGLYNSIIYQDTERLERFRQRFEKVKYIIAPDYSLFGDFPNALQIFNVYKSRVCMCWLLQNTKAIVIPNIRWSLPFAYNYCFDGIMKNSNIAIGLMGMMHHKENKNIFLDGFKRSIDCIMPKSIIVYGFITKDNIDEYLGYAIKKGIKIIVPHSKIDMYKKENAIYGCR